MKLRNYKVLGMLALPVAALAVAAVLLSMNLGSSTHQASAVGPGTNPGLEYSLSVSTGGPLCNTVLDVKGVCAIPEGSNFVAAVTLSNISGIGNAAYAANAITWLEDTVGKFNPAFDANALWPECVFEAPAPAPVINVGCGVGFPPAPQSSTFLGVVATETFGCKVGVVGTISLLHGASDTLVVDTKGATQFEKGPDVLNIACVPGPTVTPIPPTATPPPIPRVFKSPALQNIFMTRQGLKIPPVRCDDGTNVAILNEQINQSPVTQNQKLEDQDLAAFEFEVRFDPTKVCVNLIPAAQWTAAGAICFVQDKDSSTLEGIARIGCVTQGKGVDTDGLDLATIEVRPQPELFSQIRPNQDNGNVVQILNQACELADEQGHAIPIFSCEDADITFRFLEGDVDGPDCDVDVFDTQAVSFRWGVNKGSLIYNSFMDLEPSGQVKGDGDIDIKDIQFVFGRFGSLGIPQKGSTGPCTGDGSEIWPPQPPINPKA